MLTLKEIKRFYPEALHPYERFMMREYLQCKILEIIFNSGLQRKLSFIGGTCLRLVHGNNRFSEDLDFDNFNLTENEFQRISDTIQHELTLLGYEVEMKNVMRGAWHCYIRFPDLLFQEGLSAHKEEKILIQIDAEPHGFDYSPDKPILNRFDVFTPVNATPLDILLAQKFYAVLNRKVNKGRDFFDIVFIMGAGITPSFEYLHTKTQLSNMTELKSSILDKCKTLDMNEMANDVAPFLFSSKDVSRVTLFPEYFASLKIT
jgi:predicted nucleotidyltransferase component of viral defense system